MSSNPEPDLPDYLRDSIQFVTGQTFPSVADIIASAAPAFVYPFVLQRDADVTGVSGTGVVADGVLWHDGTVALRWRGERPSTVMWGSLDDAIAVHGHDGRTRVLWPDGYDGGPATADDAPPTGGDAPTTTPVDESGGPLCDHMEPGTPCDWDRCAQPDRLAQGDRGGVPTTPTLDALRAGQPVWRGPIEGYGTGEMIGILDSDPSTWGGVPRQWGPGDPPNPPIGQGRQYCSPLVNAACPGHDEPPYCDQDPASSVTVAAPLSWADGATPHVDGPTTAVTEQPTPGAKQLRRWYTAALTREHHRRARERIVASPKEHCAAMADVIMTVRDAEMDELRAERDELRHQLDAVEEQPPPNDVAVAAELRSIADAIVADAETYPGAGADWHNGIDHAIKAMRARADWMDHRGDEPAAGLPPAKPCTKHTGADRQRYGCTGPDPQES